MKPHLFRADGEWWCCASGFVGRGATPFAAWLSWLTISLSRYEVEA
jgi:hypothetical protein